LLSVFRQGGICRALAPALCWALLFRVLIPLSHIPPTQPGVDWQAAEESASFCHVDGGPLDIPSDRNREPGNKAPIGKHPFCPICLAAHLAGTFTQPAAVTIPFPAIIQGSLVPAGFRTGLAEIYRTPAQPRAPPLIDT